MHSSSVPHSSLPASHYFCTLFNINFVSYGVTMIESLAKHCPDFHLYVFAFCDESYRLLQTLALPRVTVLSLRDLEAHTPRLLEVKPARILCEYCWTCTPAAILYCIETFHLPHCCYLDADLYFYSNPKILFDELGDGSVLLTDHHYNPGEFEWERTGRYCVQFMPFRADECGLRALRWWRDACLEWCYNRCEDGKFGDQKYLDDWTTRFEGVRASTNWGAGIAPWNVHRYDFDVSKEPATVTDQHDGTTHPIVFFHYQNVKLFPDGKIALKHYHSIGVLPKRVKRCLLDAYAHHLIQTSQRLHAICPRVRLVRFSLRNASNIAFMIKKYRRLIISVRFSKRKRRLCLFGIHLIKEKGC